MSDTPPRPEPPPLPDPADCCDSGCEPCIYDLYTEMLLEYRAALAEWETRYGLDAAAASADLPDKNQP